MITTLVQETGTDFAPQQLLLACEEGWRKAQQALCPVLVSVSAPTASTHLLAFFAAGATVASERVYWGATGWCAGFCRCRHGLACGDRGRAAFSRRGDSLAGLDARCCCGATAGLCGCWPHGTERFQFRGRGQAWAVGAVPGRLLQLPRFMLVRTPQGALLTINILLHPDSAPQEEARAALYALERLVQARRLSANEQGLLTMHDVLPAARWQAKVATAVEAIRAGAFEKVMLARGVQITDVKAFDVAATLARLEADYPGCFIFALGRGHHCFLGASPERLVGLRNGRVAVTALAGTFPRAQAQKKIGS
ncbi:hypothetical protein HC891_25845 [Candidatus Gracilibacteria bacterium]|nr:hypothetical protein [Candidatus Gracilibacteria bacterium]